MAGNGSGIVAGIYANALLACATERGEGATVAAAAVKLASIFDNATVQQLENPRLGRERAKATLVAAAASVQAPKTLSDFLCLLLDRHRLVDAAAILNETARLYNHAVGANPVLVTVAAAPAPMAGERIAAQVRTAVGAQAQVTIVVDQQLIGGLTIRHGDQLIDASVRRRIDDLRRLALATPVSDAWLTP